MKAWSTKYAMTVGIQQVEGESSAPGMFTYKSEYGFTAYLQGKDWHTTKEAAVARANEMRVKKIDSLRKQIKKLEGMTF